MSEDNWSYEWDPGKTYEPGDEVAVLIFEPDDGYPPLPLFYKCVVRNRGVHPHYREAEHQDSWQFA